MKPEMADTAFLTPEERIAVRNLLTSRIAFFSEQLTVTGAMLTICDVAYGADSLDRTEQESALVAGANLEAAYLEAAYLEPAYLEAATPVATTSGGWRSRATVLGWLDELSAGAARSRQLSRQLNELTEALQPKTES